MFIKFVASSTSISNNWVKFYQMFIKFDQIVLICAFMPGAFLLSFKSVFFVIVYNNVCKHVNLSLFNFCRVFCDIFNKP